MSQKQFNLAKIIEINKKSYTIVQMSQKNSLNEPINNSNEQKQFK